jgi:hypothetical protein
MCSLRDVAWDLLGIMPFGGAAHGVVLALEDGLPASVTSIIPDLKILTLLESQSTNPEGLVFYD